MISKKESIIKNALLEASLERINLIESMNYPEIKTDNDYDDKVLNMIYNESSKKKRYPKKIALILIASITVCFLILFSISAQVRRTVIDFFVEIYDTFASFFVVKNDIQTASTIEIMYEPKYLGIVGYQKLLYSQTNYNLTYKWTRNHENIYFSQYIINENNIVLDIENTEYETTYIGEQKVYYMIKNNVCMVKWLAYGYSFSINCDTDLSWEEIEKIVLSLEPAEE